MISGTHITHSTLASQNYWLADNGESDRDDLLQDNYVLGRIGPVFGGAVKVVAFWNHIDNNPQVKACLQKLVADGFAHPDYYVVGDVSTVKTVAEYLGNLSVNAPVSQHFSPEMLRKLHGMDSPAKKQVMAALGYKPKNRPNPMPGVKWWAATSENFREWLMQNE
jgi:hypothetical protein